MNDSLSLRRVGIFTVTGLICIITTFCEGIHHLIRLNSNNTTDGDTELAVSIVITGGKPPPSQSDESLKNPINCFIQTETAEQYVYDNGAKDILYSLKFIFNDVF